MATIIFILILSPLWGILIVEDLLKLHQSLHSDFLIIDILIQLLRCPLCLSYHISWIAWLVILGNFWGMIFGVLSYWTAFLLKKYLFNIW